MGEPNEESGPWLAAFFVVGLPGVSFQVIRRGNRSSHKDFSICIDGRSFGLTRDELAEALSAENIQVKKYFFPPLHKQRLIGL